MLLFYTDDQIPAQILASKPFVLYANELNFWSHRISRVNFVRSCPSYQGHHFIFPPAARTAPHLPTSLSALIFCPLMPATLVSIYR